MSPDRSEATDGHGIHQRVSGPGSLRSRYWYDTEDPIYINLRGVLFKLPRSLLGKKCEALAGAFALGPYHLPHTEGATVEDAVVMDWIYPGDWEYLMDCIVGEPSFCNQFPVVTSGVNAHAGLSHLPDGDDENQEDEDSIEAYLMSGILPSQERIRFELDPKFPFDATNLPRLRPLFSIINLADQFLFESARQYAVAAVENHEDFLCLDPRDQLRIAQKVKVAEWARIPFLTFVRATRGRYSIIVPGDGELLHGERMAIIWNTHRKARSALAYAVHSLALATKSQVIQDDCNKSGTVTTWYTRGWAYLQRALGYEQPPADASSCSQVWDLMLTHDVLMPLLDTPMDPSTVEERLRVHGEAYLCRICYTRLLDIVIKGGLLSSKQMKVEQEGLYDFIKVMI